MFQVTLGTRKRWSGCRALFQTTIEKSEATLVVVDTFYRPPLKKVNSMVTDRRTEQQESERWLQTDAGTNINSKVTDRQEKFNKSTHGFNQTKKNSNKGYRQMTRITTTNDGYRQTKG